MAQEPRVAHAAVQGGLQRYSLGTCYMYSSRYSRLCLLDLQSIVNSVRLYKCIHFIAI